MVTTSSTSSKTSATQNILTTLGAGSGIDMASLATNLAAAQFAGRTDRLQTKSDTLDKQISAATNLKSMLTTLSQSIGTRVRQGDLSPQPEVANSAVAKASLSGTPVQAGSFTLEVTDLATSQTLASPPLASATSTTGSGTLTLRFGTIASGAFTEDTSHAAVDITIPAGATLSDVAGRINAAKAGVTAYVANTVDGARLVLKGSEGAANAFVLEATETVGDEGLANLAWNPAGDATRLLKSASDAQFKLDGLPATAPGNKVSSAIPGVDLQLTATNRGAPTTITFSDPGSAITTAMQDLTDALNQVASELSKDIDPLSGDLARDDGARSIRRAFSQLAGTVVMPNAASSAPRTLADLGLATQRDGTFKLDTVRLAATLKSDPQGAAAMFTNGLFGVYATVDSMVRKTVQSTIPGSLTASIARYTSQKTKVSDDLSKIADQQESLRAQLAQRFSWTDTNVGSSKSTLSFLQNQIAAWNKSTN